MYRAMIVDDEPAALEYLCSVIEKKCSGFEIAAQAGNGEEALALIDTVQPDIVITDINMPRMDGISLVSRLYAQYPEVATVIVSGYQDFEYAKGAIQSGVSDYLLKPLKPSDMQKLLKRVELKIGRLYHSRRTELMKAMCGNRHFEANMSLARYFPSPSYYAAIIRKNGLPKRFTRQTGFEIFSTEDEVVMLYGRDEMEALYLYPQEMLGSNPFSDTVRQLYEAEHAPRFYVTAVYHNASFPISAFPDVVQTLYHKLDECIVIGQNQFIEDTETTRSEKAAHGEQEQRELVEYLIRNENGDRLLDEAGKLVDIWRDAGHTQLQIENQLRYLLHLISEKPGFLMFHGNYDFLLDEILYNVANMEELKHEVEALLRIALPASSRAEFDKPERLFEVILAYLRNHIEEPLTIGALCDKFNLSQATLSRWFRKYKGMSLGNYLTEMRIDKAKLILTQHPDVHIKDVAERLGYSDQFYFSRIFRSVVGVCPSDYTNGGKRLNAQ